MENRMTATPIRPDFILLDGHEKTLVLMLCIIGRYRYAFSETLSIGESLSALCASSLEDLSSVSGSHSLSEAMLNFSLTLFRLICSKHLLTPPSSRHFCLWNIQVNLKSDIIF